MTDSDEKSPGAMHNAILRLLDENAAIRKQLDEAREREAQMAAALRKGRDCLEALASEHFSIDPYTGNAMTPDDRHNLKVVRKAASDMAAALSQEPPASHAPGNGSKIIGALEQAARGEAARVTVVEVASHAPVLRDADTAPVPADVWAEGLSSKDIAMIDAAWEKHKAAAPAPAISGGEMVRTLRDVLAWLDDPRMGQWPYMEGGDFDMDRSSHAEFIRNLLAAADRSAP